MEMVWVPSFLLKYPQSVGNGGSTRSDSQTCYTTLEGCYTVFEYRLLVRVRA